MAEFFVYMYIVDYLTVPYNCDETLVHVPSSCIVVTVHVVKGRQYSVYTVPHAGADMESETDSRLDSNKFRCFNQSQGRTRQQSTASELQID
jgi:hypothetical protein